MAIVTRNICKYFIDRGWKAGVIVKRGTGCYFPLELTSTKAWGFLDFDDFKLAIDHVAEK